MAKPELEMFDPDLSIPWRPVEGDKNGTMEKILSLDPETGSYTRLLKFPPMEKSSEAPLVHDFWEEVYIVSGKLIDLTTGQTQLAGYYGCRPPGMFHGPFSIPDGATTFEIRTFVKK